MSVLVLADHDQGQLSPATPRVISAASRLGVVEVLVAGSGVAAVAAAVSTIAGVTKVIVVDEPALVEAPAQALAKILEELAPAYSYIVAAAAAVGRDVVPRLAARLDLMPVTDIVEIIDATRFVRPIYAGNALQTIVSTQARQLLTIRAAAFRPAPAVEAPAPIASHDTVVSATVRFIGEERTAGNRPDLGTAQIVVAGGVSLGSAEKFGLVEELAQALGGAVGATRAAVDAGYAPNDWQVGQTGKIVAPDIYIGVGVSGALQHLAGIQGAKMIIAINKDPEAPLMKIADLAFVGDLFEVLPELIAGLKRA